MVIGVLTDIRFIEVIMKQNEILGSEICEAIKLLTSHGYAVRSGIANNLFVSLKVLVIGGKSIRALTIMNLKCLYTLMVA